MQLNKDKRWEVKYGHFFLKFFADMDRVQRLQDFLKQNPDDSFLQHALALEYVKKGEAGLARQQWEQLLHRDPAYVGSYYHLAQLLVQLGETEQAIRWYEQGMAAAKAANDLHALAELRSAYEEFC
ncbi:MAG: tetratricopeptide repeat protein [Sphingobacteriales bacterium]|jgi:tetratricopeptide (TPR) repeat protein|nr:tetratricopeptide repeat protein [Sphingobacteriales bacterium]